MKHYVYLRMLYAFLSLAAISCAHSPQAPQATSQNPVQTTYKNPVFEPILADPTIVKASDGWFYGYGTMDNWGDGAGARLVPIVKSQDLVHWTYVKDAFTAKPNWKEEGGIWAPEVVQVGGQYYMYYAFSKWGDPDPGIGLAIASSPEGPFVDAGKVFLSSEINVPNSIDPFYIEENGKKYLFWGSFSDLQTQGTYGVPLSDDGKTAPDLTKKFKVAAGDFEAVMIQKHDDYYYFFGSKGSCCDFERSQYRVLTGRSKSLFGPYLDKEGRELTTRGAGTLLLESNEKYAGPGHNARLIRDTTGQDWFLYHAIDKANPRVSSGANRRVLMLDKLTWNNGWPEISGGKPSIESKPAPLFK